LNDIKPTSRVFTFDLDSAKTGTGGTRGNFGSARVIGIVILSFGKVEDWNIEYIDFSNAYIAYMRGIV